MTEDRAAVPEFAARRGLFGATIEGVATDRTTEEPAVHRAWTRIRGAVRWVGDRVGRLVADSPPSDKPPGGNYIPNSTGEGGRVISSGDSGAQ